MNAEEWSEMLAPTGFVKERTKANLEQELMQELKWGNMDLVDAIQYGINLRPRITAQVLSEVANDCIEIMQALGFPRFPCALPIELKGIAV